MDGLIYNSARSFEEFGDSLSNEDAIALRDAIESARVALDVGDLHQVQESHDALFNAAQRLADAIYGSLDTDFADDDSYDYGEDEDSFSDETTPMIEIEDDFSDDHGA